MTHEEKISLIRRATSAAWQLSAVVLHGMTAEMSKAEVDETADVLVELWEAARDAAND